jgi:hypothetical protein
VGRVPSAWLLFAASAETTGAIEEDTSERQFCNLGKRLAKYSQIARLTGGAMAGEAASNAAPVMPSELFEVPIFDLR